MTYLTDGVYLYEVVSQRADQNFGRLGGFLRSTIVRECITEETATLDDLSLAALSPVEDAR